MASSGNRPWLGPGDYTVTVTDDSLLPWVRPGERVTVTRRTDLRDGDVGVFHAREGMVFRQYCRDSQGTVYLFAVNRREREKDLAVPPSRFRRIVCYGRVVLPERIPLPVD